MNFGSGWSADALIGRRCHGNERVESQHAYEFVAFFLSQFHDGSQAGTLVYFWIGALHTSEFRRHCGMELDTLSSDNYICRWRQLDLPVERV